MTIEDELRALTDQWLAETMFLSSVTQIVAHRAYLQIIDKGERAVRFILEELQRAPGHWGPALTAITGVDPVPAADAGRMSAIREAWLRWGREQGYLPEADHCRGSL